MSDPRIARGMGRQLDVRRARLDSGERSKLQLKKGDEVLFSSYAGTEIKVKAAVGCVSTQNGFAGRNDATIVKR